MGIEFDNTRDGALSGFFSCGSVNGLRGSGASDLTALGVGWVKRIFHLYFPSNGSRLLFCCLLLILVTVECVL